MDHDERQRLRRGFTESEERAPLPSPTLSDADIARIADGLWKANEAANETFNEAMMPVANDEQSDRAFLQWIHERLQYVHGESPNVDYMHKLRAIIAATPRDQHTCNCG